MWMYRHAYWRCELMYINIFMSPTSWHETCICNHRKHHKVLLPVYRWCITNEITAGHSVSKTLKHKVIKMSWHKDHQVCTRGTQQTAPRDPRRAMSHQPLSTGTKHPYIEPHSTTQYLLKFENRTQPKATSMSSFPKPHCSGPGRISKPKHLGPSQKVIFHSCFERSLMGFFGTDEISWSFFQFPPIGRSVKEGVKRARLWTFCRWTLTSGVWAEEIKSTCLSPQHLFCNKREITTLCDYLWLEFVWFVKVLSLTIWWSEPHCQIARFHQVEPPIQIVQRGGFS